MQIVSRDADASKPSDDWTLPAEAQLDESISPEPWQSYSEDWVYTATEAELAWAQRYESLIEGFHPDPEDAAWHAAVSNAGATDFEVISEPELEYPGTRAEYEAFLDAIAPTPDELELRDVTNCGFGHAS